VSPPRDEGLTLGYVTIYTLLLVAIALVDQTAPSETAPTWRRLGWVLVEIVLCSLVVRTQGTLIRPALIYLLPVGRAILLFGQRTGVLASLLVWVAYAINIAPGAWPDHLGDFPNYLSFFLAPYAVAVILSAAIVRQEHARRSIQTLYDQLTVVHHELQVLHQEVRSAAVAEERNRLAREIHDSLAHYLTVANVQLEAAEKLGVERAHAALEHVRRARRLTLDCLQDVRRSVAALRAASRGDAPLQPSVARKILGRLRSAAPIAQPPRLDVLASEGLSERELAILRLLGRGAANREIAESLALTEGTVKNYISAILAKTGLHDRTQAAIFAVRHNLTGDDSG
jgi:signal transduction histidine kinase/DNA-binding CsgD family transcriptional regulator